MILYFCVSQLLSITAQQQNIPEFTWGNASYFNLGLGEKFNIMISK
ncbi:MAG: hypothetical protein IPF54_06435 [Draconibacterium sp.]|nr:hypothetical protein [Draconibacterium sp.]